MSVIDTLLPLNEKRSKFVASTNDRTSTLNVGKLVLFLSLVDHLRESLGQTSIHLLDVLSTLLFFLGTDLLLASTLFSNTTL